ncbi:MAG: energy transducer TonB [Flavobacterium sp.]
MSNVSIFEKKWLDLVFQDKNQKYGAYQLRLNSERTTFFAFLFGIGFLVGGTFLLSSFSAAPEVIPPVIITDPTIHIVDIHPPTEEIIPITKTTKPETAAVKTPEDTRNYQVAPTEQAVVPVTKTAEAPIVNGPTSPTGTGIAGSATIPGTGSVVASPIVNNGPVKPSELDRQPSFPGGMKNFYEYVGRNFEKQELDEEGETIRVLVSFVIEKNGTMTDIEVTQNTNQAVSKEAVRVLKSLKTKWEPGFKDNQAVRTRYTLPVVVQL